MMTIERPTSDDYGPTDSNRLKKARELRRSGKIAAALRVLEAALRDDCTCGEVHFEKGICYFRIGNAQEAMRSMDAAVLLGCEKAQFWSRFEVPRADEKSETDD